MKREEWLNRRRIQDDAPHWVKLEWLDGEAKRQLELKDRPRRLSTSD